MSKNKQQRGATAIFIVIFAMLLLSIIAISFLGTMLREKGRSLDDELSESAYDSALAGVEDGKRALEACAKGKAVACSAIKEKKCDTTSRAGIVTETDGEVKIRSKTFGGGKNELNQAYTCVKVNRKTNEYKGRLGADDSVIVPLKGDGGYDQVEVSWHNINDGDGYNFNNPLNPSLSSLSSWERPALFKAQYMQYSKGTLKPAEFNDDGKAHTVFLYPNDVGSASHDIKLKDLRRDGSAEPVEVKCQSSPGIVGYVCSTKLILPPMPNRVAYLRLTSMYKSAHFQVKLLDGASAVVKFDGVQPIIDSTGRANDVYRRVEARVEAVDRNFPFPRATIDISNNFCKNFSLTENDFFGGSCNPSISGI
ncbi:hypothetical protein CR956_01805 [Candidatus Saccharibacteria bacterium]|nr:MAG: hypothetical protein CR956_01805 [Candidatus Saccharibacteria bacterium]